jgi:hypothetical protein
MRHAGDEDLAAISDLLTSLRGIDALTERRPGVFYRRGRSLLHFHVDGADLYADVRTDPTGAFERVRVTTKTEQRHLLASIRRALAASGASPRS